MTALTNGNYVVASPAWDNGAIQSAGAVTWGNGTAGVTGGVHSLNSLVGSSGGDQVGRSGVTALTNGNYGVASPNWSNGGRSLSGAGRWGRGASGVSEAT